MPGRREKDVDYLALSARVRAMENRLLTQERLDRMIDVIRQRRPKCWPSAAMASWRN